MSRLFVNHQKQRPVPRTSTNSDPTRQLILEQAAKMFRSYGYENTSLAMIAEAINFTAPAIYRHFPSKYELFASSVLKLQTSFDDRMEQLSHEEGASAATKIRALTIAHALNQLQRAIPEGTGSNRVVTIGLLAESLNEPERTTVLSLQRKHLDRVRSIVIEGMKAGEFNVVDPTVVAFAIIALPEHLVLWYKPSGRIGQEEVAEALADLALRMLVS